MDIRASFVLRRSLNKLEVLVEVVEDFRRCCRDVGEKRGDILCAVGS